ncbi:hypothetical protein OHA98_37075 [Streptomyces sp. NBC_00654]|uniref:hypothetical protein n=1 Tax=Streptomyces sp. NBC_00654 TaxID=2975799 RepID=UPI00225396B8|nr:hypothetical protein [Streptomyces sp. NBC_00654]MCX4970277.1 hypothetical protein [Streptomyces sp. NBC_00654]
MRATAVRRTALAASVASLALLATACGGSSDASGSDGKGGGASGAAAGDGAGRKPAVKTLTAAELKKASLVQGDVKGNKIAQAGPGDQVKAGSVTVDKKECEPFAHAYLGVEQGEPVARTQRTAVSEPKKTDKGTSLEDLAEMPEGDAEDAFAAAFDLTSTLVSLSSYEGQGAPETLAAVRESAAKCGGGFSITMDGDTQKVAGLTEEKVTGGDEAIGWTVTSESEGKQVPFKLVAMRRSGTFATFVSFNLAATGGRAEGFELPTAIVTAQAAKLS